MRILIIEDEPDIRKTIEYNFVKEGFKVSVAGSIAEGKKTFSSRYCQPCNFRSDVARWLRFGFLQGNKV